MMSDNLNLRGRAAIVTGASKGIGAATARRLAEAGVNVAVNFLRDEEGARRVASDIEAAGARYLLVRGDVRKLSD
jgi:3-oxoacyl-[acyl-carrier protein] reductase